MLESLKMDAVYKAAGHLPQASSPTRLIVTTAFAGIMRLQLVSQSHFGVQRATQSVRKMIRCVDNKDHKKRDLR